MNFYQCNLFNNSISEILYNYYNIINNIIIELNNYNNSIYKFINLNKEFVFDKNLNQKRLTKFKELKNYIDELLIITSQKFLQMQNYKNKSYLSPLILDKFHILEYNFKIVFNNNYTII